MIALLLTMLTPNAFATEDDQEKAFKLFAEGNELREQGDLAKAIELWWQSYELAPDKGAVVLSYIAKTEERRGNTEQALGIWKRFLPVAEGERRQEAQAAIDRLERSIPPPAPEPEPSEPDVEPPSPQPTTPPPAVVQAGGGTKGLGVALIGVGVVSGGAGLASALISNSAGNRVADNCKGPDTSSGLCTVDAASDYRTHRTTAALADVGFVLGAAAVVTGTLLVVTSKGKRTSVAVGLDGIRIGGRL